jgi:ribosomal protein S18 acetylase RimI-like enzyme
VVWTAGSADDLLSAAQLLFDFNTEFGEPAPPPATLARRLAQCRAAGVVVLLVGAGEVRSGAGPVAHGVAVMRLAPSLWSPAQEAYLAEFYVSPERRGRGLGTALLAAVVRRARDEGADYAFLITSEHDVQAQRVYRNAGFRHTEGDEGPAMIAFELDLPQVGDGDDGPLTT